MKGILKMDKTLIELLRRADSLPFPRKEKGLKGEAADALEECGRVIERLEAANATLRNEDQKVKTIQYLQAELDTMTAVAGELQDKLNALRKMDKEKKYIHMNPSEAADALEKRDKRIKELQAENRIFRSTENVSDSVWDALLEQIREHQLCNEELDRTIAVLIEWARDNKRLLKYLHDEGKPLPNVLHKVLEGIADDVWSG